jgi:hypothetical protein
MLHVVEAGPRDNRRKAFWNERTGDLTGDNGLSLAPD